MAIRDDNTPPTKPGSITQTADSQIDRIGNISNVSKTVSNMQKDVKQQITETQKMVDESEGISSVQSSMTKVLDKVAETIGALSTGVKTITVDTAKATKDAIGDYGKAISQDISFNKQSVVAMALAKSTPIYGYFVAKFMETDVFKRAAERMKQSIGKAFGSLAGVFRRGAKEPGKEKIPHMQKGGYVEKAGIAKIHAGEVVMPIEKILARMDESTSVTKNVSKILSKMTFEQAATSKAMSTMVVRQGELMADEKRVGMVKDFLRVLRQEKERYKDPIDVQQLRAMLAIKEVLGAEIKIWPEVWSKLLMKHPMFRNIAAVTKLAGKLAVLTLWKPIYGLFKRRGGYARYLSKSDKPLTAMSQNIGLHYVESAWRYDNMLNMLKAIAVATRDMAAVMTGRKYPRIKGVGTGEWSFGGGAIRLGLAAVGQAMRGVGKIPGMGFMGRGGKALSERALTGRYAGSYKLGETEGGTEGRPGSKKFPMYVQDITWLPITDAVQLTFREFEKRLPVQTKQLEMITESAVEQLSTMQRIKKRLKSNWIIKMLLIGWGFVSVFVKKLWDRTAGKFLKFAKPRLLSLLGGAQGRIGGTRLGRAFGRIPPGMKKVMGAGGIAAGVAMGVHDAMKAVAMSKEWETSKLSAGIGGALGGVGGGVGGALKGAAKFGMIGAGIGSFVPVIGTAIGGAIGAIAGGVLGFVGGKNIAKGFDAIGKQIKKFAKAAWSIVTWPFSLLGKAWDWFKEQLSWKNLYKHAKSGLSLIWKIVQLPYKAVWGLMKFFTPGIAEKLTKAKEWLKKPIDSLLGIFTWIGNLFKDIKNWIVDGVYAIPGMKWILGERKGPPDKPSKGGAKDTTTAAEEASREAPKGFWNTIKAIGKGPVDPATMYGKAKGGAEEAAKKAKSAGITYYNKLTPKAREAFETAKRYYMKEFGWTEAQADAVLSTIATTAGDKLDLFTNPEKLKEMGMGMYSSLYGAAAGAKERVTTSMIDKGKIAVNQASLMLANGELIAEDLGKKIVDSSKDLADKTMQGAGAVISTINTSQTVSNTSNSTAVGGGGSGSKTEGRTYFDNLVYTGNYR